MRLGQKGSPEMSREDPSTKSSIAPQFVVRLLRAIIGYCESVNGAYPTI